MWKKLTLLAAVAGTITQAWRWSQARARAAEQRQARHETQRWEEEGGNPPPQAAPKDAGIKAVARRPRVRASTGTASRGGRTSSAASA